MTMVRGEEAGTVKRATTFHTRVNLGSENLVLGYPLSRHILGCATDMISETGCLTT
jgi:hypothetical protein